MVKIKVSSNSFSLLVFLLSLNSADAVTIESSCAIVVDPGPFHTSEVAANAEESIDWSGSDFVRMKACTENYAAQELRYYLCRMLAGNPEQKDIFPILPPDEYTGGQAIILGDVQLAKTFSVIDDQQVEKKLGTPESFMLVPRKNLLYIIGGDRTGTLYGVYAFLELLGVRWYGPENIEEIVPLQPTLSFPDEIIFESPRFITRGFWAWEDRGDKEFFIWMARNRLNFWTIAAPNRAFLRKLGIQLTVGGHMHQDRFLNPEAEYPFAHNAVPTNQKPEDPYKVNPEAKDTDNDGKLTYFEAHPEWYGLVDGRRKAFKGDFGTNFCTANMDAVTELSRKLVEDLATGAWRDATTVNFWMLDGGNWCECDECSLLGTPTDRLLLLVFHLRRAISTAQQSGQINRTIQIIFPIYHETLEPPTRPLPEDFDYDNIIGTIFPIARCYGHYIDDPTCTEYNVKIWHDILNWTQNEPRYYEGNFFIGEYFNVAPTKNLPVLYTEIMKHDIPLYYQQNMRHSHYMHVYTRLLGMKRINNYLFARLLWDPSIDVDLILNDYFNYVYGKGAETMTRLYHHLEFATSSIKQLKHYDGLTVRINKDKRPLFNTNHLRLNTHHPPTDDGVDLEQSLQSIRICRALLDSLLALPWDQIITERLRIDDQNLSYMENMLYLLNFTARSIKALRMGDRNVARYFYQVSIPFASLLLDETEIPQTGSSHSNAANGLEATDFEEVYIKLGTNLGFDFPSMHKFYKKDEKREQVVKRLKSSSFPIR